MKNILVTGGPVHAHLDAVKIITNRFKGGLMVRLVNELLRYDVNISYLYPSDMGLKIPDTTYRNLTLYGHSGFDDYRRLVLELAPKMDAVILGAAVANLIPAKPFKGKFPSHNYKPGDIIPIDFTIAPRVIDEIKKIALQTHLFGFKLLSDVKHEELIRAAYEIVLSSGATAVFANDAVNLKRKYAVTKERGIHPLGQDDLAEWIWRVVNDLYYRSILVEDQPIPLNAESKIKGIINRFSSKFVTVESGMIFGTVAIRYGSGFITTGRGKHELDDIVHVLGVDHTRRELTVEGGKASLNAPLLARVFENQNVDYIVHYHEQEGDVPSFPYAPPGTARDTDRANSTSFNIVEHGCVLLFNKDGKRL